jgi:hypothetical protein
MKTPLHNEKMSYLKLYTKPIVFHFFFSIKPMKNRINGISDYRHLNKIFLWSRTILAADLGIKYIFLMKSSRPLM